MRLTNAIRDSFVDNVIAALPPVDKYVKFEAQQKLQTYVEKTYLPEDVLSFYKKYPHLVRRGCTLYVDKLNDKNRVFSFDVIDSIPFEIKELLQADLKYMTIVDELLSLKKQESQQLENIRELKDRLRKVALSCTTTEKLVAVLPELTQFVPTSTQTPNIPVAVHSIAKDLKAAGLILKEDSDK